MKRVLVLMFVSMVTATYEVTEEDICCLEKDTGPCEADIPRWYYNVEKGACEKFSYGGCEGNENNFLNKCACLKQCGGEKDICCLEKDTGPCDAAIPRWYYNAEKGACEKFSYGGCKGNENNFQNKCACQKRCGGDKDICCLEKDTGPCKAAIPRWYYNAEKGACEKFTYGGCKGNENNFQNKCACQKRCGGEKDVCCLEKDVGPCKAAINRWYYNVEKGACEKFSYGGCKGNENNFLNICACQKRCGGEKDICCLEKVVGPCKAAMPRWYYNVEKGACEKFTYGGCKGNENNFQKKCACEKRCVIKNK